MHMHKLLAAYITHFDLHTLFDENDDEKFSLILNITFP